MTDPVHPNALTWWANRRKQAYMSLLTIIFQIAIINLLIFNQVPLDVELKSVLVWLNSGLLLIVLAYHGGSLAADWMASNKP
jgi:hypothetical protein